MTETANHDSAPPSDRTVEQRRFDRLVALPPSAKLVAYVLDDESPLTTSEIGDRTLLPKRTARNALRVLKDEDLVEIGANPLDARRWRYTLRPMDRPSTRSKTR